MATQSRFHRYKNAHLKSDKINEALALLNEAAKEKKEEINQLIYEKYSNIRDAFNEAAQAGKDVLNDAKAATGRAVEAGQEQIRGKAREMDQRVREKPWAILGGVALASFILGLIVRGGSEEEPPEYPQ